jgi:hypothetical protein
MPGIIITIYGSAIILLCLCYCIAKLCQKLETVQTTTEQENAQMASVSTTNNDHITRPPGGPPLV